MTAVRFWLALTSVFLLALMGSGVGSIAAAPGDGRDGSAPTRSARIQTDDTDESEDSDATDEDEESSDEEAAASPDPADIEIDSHNQTIGQGLAAFDSFSNGVWRITEMSPRPVDEALPVTAPFYGFLYQMEGTTVIRNNVSGKRARIEPGEAYYFSAGDSYTRYREEEASRAWLIEIVPDDTSDEDAPGIVLFTSGEIDSFPDDTRDLELLASHVMPDETSSVPDFEADALIMVTVGELEVTDSEGSVPMPAPAALLVTGSLEIENVSNEPASYIVARIGPAVADFTGVIDEDAAADDPESDEESTDDAGETSDADEPLVDTDGDTLVDVDEAAWGTDPTIADSDFDGYSDGDEVFIYYTDPLDPNSYP